MNIRKLGFIASCFMFTACSINPTYTALSSTSDGSPLDDIFIYRKYDHLNEWYKTKIATLIRSKGFEQFIKNNKLMCNEDISLCKKELCIRYEISNLEIIYKYSIIIYNEVPSVTSKAIPVMSKLKALKKGFYNKKNFNYFLGDQLCKPLIKDFELR